MKSKAKEVGTKALMGAVAGAVKAIIPPLEEAAGTTERMAGTRGRTAGTSKKK